MRAKKIDANQNAIVKSLRQIPGVSVAVTSGMGNGFTDLVIGYKLKNFIIELKDGQKSPSRKRLTKDEEKFKGQWRGQYDVAETFDDCLKIIGL